MCKLDKFENATKNQFKIARQIHFFFSLQATDHSLKYHWGNMVNI